MVMQQGGHRVRPPLISLGSAVYIKKRLCLAVSIAIAGLPAAHAQSTANATPDGSADAATLDRIEVRPQFESQMRAIDFKRDSDAIKDVVSSDAMGQYPDKNVAESLQRLPGVSVTRDQGEGRYVVIRGLDAALNSVSVDGVNIGTPEDSSRAAPLDVIPSDSTERLTVVKAPTPDMPGDSIGGQIQVESASAFDRDGRSIRAKIEASHQSLSGETSPKAAFNFSEVFNDTFGVAFGINYQDRDFESDNIEVEYDYVGEPDDADNPFGSDLVAREIQLRKYTINRKRIGSNLNLDWRPNDSSSYFIRALYSDFTDAETRQRSIIPFDGEGTVTGEGKYRFDEVDPGDFSRRVRFRTKEENTLALSTGGSHRFSDAGVDYRFGYTKTRERVNDEVEARFSYDGDEDISIVLDQTSNIPSFDVIDPAGDAWLRNENYTFNRFVFSPKQIDDEEKSFAVNSYFNGENVTLKMGLLGRWRDRDVNVDEVEYRRGPKFNLGGWTSASPSFSHGNMGDGISSAAMRDFLKLHRDEYSSRPQEEASNLQTSLVEDYVASEDVLAAYAMATMDFGQLRVIAGARLESTTFHAVGNEVDIDEDGDIAYVGKRTANSSYSNVLPGLHLRYDTANDWVLRGAYTHTIARPAFGDISPRMSINREDEEISLGNPELDPYKSRNIDLSVEHYIGESGIFSVGAFHKSIKGYIVETITKNDPAYPGFEVIRPINGDDARVYGLELNYQQQLDFLPGVWSGLLVGFSGTWLDTEFKVNGETFTLPNASDRIYSAHVGYERSGFSTRIAAVYRNDYLDTIGDSADFDIYVAPNTQLDFSLDYKINKRWGVYFEASNLLDEPLELYQGNRSNTLQNELYGRTYAVGVKINL